MSPLPLTREGLEGLAGRLEAARDGLPSTWAEIGRVRRDLEAVLAAEVLPAVATRCLLAAVNLCVEAETLIEAALPPPRPLLVPASRHPAETLPKAVAAIRRAAGTLPSGDGGPR